MLPLSFSDVARIEVPDLLRGDERGAKQGRGRGEQEDAFTHDESPYRRRNKRAALERRMTERGSSADGEELGPTLGDELVRTNGRAAVQLLDDRALERSDRSVGVTMRAPQRLRDDAIDDA